jgi:hypothetical protein
MREEHIECLEKQVGGAASVDVVVMADSERNRLRFRYITRMSEIYQTTISGIKNHNQDGVK